MQDPAVKQEKAAQYRKDRAGYNRLSMNDKMAAALMANDLLKKRRIVVGISRALVGLAEMTFNIVLRLPYTLAAKAISKLAKGAVGVVKMSVGAVAAMRRGAFASRRGGLKLAGAAAKFLYTRNIISPARGQRFLQGLTARQNELLARAAQTTAWAQEKKRQIDRLWENTRESLKKAKDATFSFMEYYGAIGLYKGASWLLNPRTSAGKPLLGNERKNKIYGVVAGAVLFSLLAFQITKLAALGKMLHFKLVTSLATDQSTVAMKLLKQAVFHPLLTAGVTAIKFFGLPVLAATKRAVKSIDFTQGIAYRYNRRLDAQDRFHVRQKFLLASVLANTTAPRTLWEVFTDAAKKKSMAFVETFVTHIVEKASPEFYEAREKFYAATRTGNSSPVPLPTPKNPGPMNLDIT